MKALKVYSFSVLYMGLISSGTVGLFIYQHELKGQSIKIWEGSFLNCISKVCLLKWVPGLVRYSYSYILHSIQSDSCSSFLRERDTIIILVMGGLYLFSYGKYYHYWALLVFGARVCVRVRPVHIYRWSSIPVCHSCTTNPFSLL